MQKQESDPAYFMGRTDGETERLKMQGVLYASSTRNLFVAAGIGAGMKVLDVGSGAGDVALLLGELVGPRGRVVGVDANAAILETARRRMADAGLHNVTLVDGDIRELPLDHDFDAIVGRLVFLYLRDPVSVLRDLVTKHLRPGGIVAFQDLDWTNGPTADPPSQVLADVWRWFREMCRRGGIDWQMGLHLHRVFTGAGLPAPNMSLYSAVGGGPDF